MLERVAVAFRGRRDEIFRAVPVGDVEGVERTERADLKGRNAVNGVIHGTGGAGEVEYVVDAAGVERFANVFFDEFKTRVILQMGKVGAAAGEQVVDNHHAVAFAEKSIAEVRAEKSGAAGDERALGGHV